MSTLTHSTDDLASPKVHLTNGTQILGNYRHQNGRDVQEYLGIRYALPPTGNRRFAKPVPLEDRHHDTGQQCNAQSHGQAPWQHVVREFGGNHPGEEIWNPQGEMSEDCLHLNIWTPLHLADVNGLLPVMIWFYGGGFVGGSTALSIYNGCRLATENVVVVAISYRVSSLGFLYLGTEEALGNQGLWDQNLALQWVQENIQCFGGNANNVTLFGESAGSVSICCHLLSPHSQHLFHRAILQSGTALSNWAVLPATEMLRRSHQLVDTVLTNRNDNNSSTIIQSLQCLPASQLIHHDWITCGLFQWPWVPVIDGDFLPDSPHNLLQEGRVKKCPLIIGTNDNEGSYFLIYSNDDRPQRLFPVTDNSSDDWTLQTFYKSLSASFEYYPYYPHRISELGMGAILSTYLLPVVDKLLAIPSNNLFDKIPTTTTTSNNNNYEDHLQMTGSILREQVCQAVGDCHITADSLTWADYNTQSGESTYVYQFGHATQADPWPQWTGVKHADEIQFVFGKPLNDGTGGSDVDQQMSTKMMELWTSFAKTGQPETAELKWPTYDPQSQQQYLYINKKFTVCSTGLRSQEKHFWKTVLPEILKSTAADR